MKEDEPLSNQEYLLKRGQICPVCRDRDGLSGGFIEVDIDQASQDVTCYSCGASWTDVYTLSWYKDLQEGED